MDNRIKVDREEAMESAMCIWEWALEQIRSDGNSTIQKKLFRCGASQLRHYLLQLADDMDRAFKVAQKLGYDDPFDWEFVPAVMSYLTDTCHTFSPNNTNWQDATLHVLPEPHTPYDLRKAIDNIVREQS